MGYYRYKVDNDMDKETEKKFDKLSDYDKDALETEFRAREDKGTQLSTKEINSFIDIKDRRKQLGTMKENWAAEKYYGQKINPETAREYYDFDVEEHKKNIQRQKLAHPKSKFIQEARLSNEDYLTQMDEQRMTANLPNQMKDFKYSTSVDDTDLSELTNPIDNLPFNIPYLESMYDNDDVDPNRIPGRIQKSLPRKTGIMENLRNRFYRPATQGVGNYTPAQLNQMNALGGYYSEPVRQQRRDRRSVSTLLARKAAAEAGTGTFSPVAQGKLNVLTMGSRPGHYDIPGGNGGVPAAAAAADMRGSYSADWT